MKWQYITLTKPSLQGNFNAAQLQDACAFIYSNSKGGRQGGENRLKDIVKKKNK